MRQVNGLCIAQTYCPSCGERENIPRGDKAPVEDIVLRDNLHDGDAMRCARCGNLGAELHHWAPSAIFNDADLWPMSPLCRECHTTWHAAMRRAGGHRLDFEDRVGETLDFDEMLAAALSRKVVQ